MPRTYRGFDIQLWLEMMGTLDRRNCVHLDETEPFHRLLCPGGALAGGDRLHWPRRIDEPVSG